MRGAVGVIRTEADRVERVLRNYPQALRIAAAIEAGTGGREYARITRNIEAVESAVAALPEHDQAVVALLWWGERRGRIERASALLGSERTCWRARGKLISALSPGLEEADGVLISDSIGRDDV